MDDSRETKDDWGLDAWRAEEVGAGEVGDIMGNFEETLRTGSACMDHALRNVRQRESSQPFTPKKRPITRKKNYCWAAPQGFALGQIVQASPPNGSLQEGQDLQRLVTMGQFRIFAD